MGRLRGAGMDASGDRSGFISTYFPAPVKWPALAIWFPIGLFLIRPLDRWLINSSRAYVLASTTYVLIAR
jgi:hypothetical protein